MSWGRFKARRPLLSRDVERDGTANMPGIVFVHGLGSSPQKCWSTLFSLCGSDDDLDRYKLDCYQYPTSRFNILPWYKLPPLSDLAHGLETFLNLRHAESSDLTLVCHSMGGLIARQYIVDCLKRGENPDTRRLLLFATPNSGAALAAVGSQILRGNRHVALLRPLSAELETLNDDWEKLNVADRVAVRYVIGGADRIVSVPSATGNANRTQCDMLIGYDHSSIVVARSRSDLNYVAAKKFILNGNGASVPLTTNAGAAGPVLEQPISDPKTGNTDQARSGNFLFEIYRVEDEPYYLVRDSDEYLFNAATGGHVWVSGPSGMGKTAALRRRALLSGWRLVHVLLSSVETQTAQHIFWSICSQIAEIDGLAPPAPSASISDIVAAFKRILRQFCKTPTTFLIEEIPLPPGPEYQLLMKHLSMMMLAIEGEEAHEVRLMFSSIHCPSGDIPTGMAKFRSRLQFLQNDRWSPQELRSLVDLLCNSAEKPLAEADRQAITMAANGSPRFVKAVFRRWHNGTDGGLPLGDLLVSVGEEQV